jgi:methionine--tRNA ligase beta chain
MAVGIDAFSQLDIRIGRIAGIANHENAKKPMFILDIDFGAEVGTRRIVAGIKGHYQEAELVGKKIACIINLEPKEIAGVASNGMVLAAEDANGISLLVPDRDVGEGSKVH